MLNNAAHDTRTTDPGQRVAAGVALEVAARTSAAVGDALVVYDFDAGDTPDTPTKNDIGFYFTSGENRPIVSAPNGSQGMLFKFGPDSATEDSMQEIRYELNGEYFETYEKIALYIPGNFEHRFLVELKVVAPGDISTWAAGDNIIGPTGSTAVVFSVEGEYLYTSRTEGYNRDDKWVGAITNTTQSLTADVVDRRFLVANNKFSLQWAGKYSNFPSESYGIMAVEFDTAAYNDYQSENSDFTAKATAAANGTSVTGNRLSTTPTPPGISPLTDSGKSVDFIIQRARASSLTANDALCRIWKDNGSGYVLVYENLTLPLFDSVHNYFERGYILGYSNSGFTEQTDILLRGYTFYGVNRPLELGDL